MAATTAASAAWHKLITMLTTPVWIGNDEYYLLKISAVCALTTLLDLYSAVANFTLRQ
jgi:hypothetical protein